MADQEQGLNRRESMSGRNRGKPRGRTAGSGGTQNPPFDLARKYDELYNRNRGNWDNPNSATSMNSPIWGPDDWGEGDRYAGVGPRGYARSDDRIKEDVSLRFAANGQLDASEITVIVENQKVTLDGTVDSRRSKRLAEAIAESAQGVRDIHNKLRIQRRR